MPGTRKVVSYTGHIRNRMGDTRVVGSNTKEKHISKRGLENTTTLIDDVEIDPLRGQLFFLFSQ
jgi:hypothetical protein